MTYPVFDPLILCIRNESDCTQGTQSVAVWFYVEILLGKGAFLKLYVHNSTFDPIYDILNGHTVCILQPICTVFFAEFVYKRTFVEILYDFHKLFVRF